ncbi:MAG: hypothetical protein ACFFD4_13825 [Candidatus Odinarchaeota archaeon]
MIVLPYLSFPSLVIVIFLIIISLIIITLTYWRHFHHFTYGVVFFCISGLFLLIYQFYQAELVTGVIFIAFFVGSVVFLLDFSDFLLLFKKPGRKIKYCKHFQACPCGCGYGLCKHEKDKLVNGKALAGDCSLYELVEHANTKVNI